MFNFIKIQFNLGNITAAEVAAFAVAGYITAQEAEVITASAP